jgi:ribonuclease R
MLDHVGDVFEGVIASVTNFGFFVRLSEFHIDGLVHITALEKDYFRYDEVKQHLIGESFGTVYRLGDPVEVKVASVNLDERKIDFLLDGVEGKNIKKTAVGNALRNTARSGLNKGYDVGSSALSNNQYTKPLGKHAFNSKTKNVDKLMQLSGLGIVDDIKKGYKKNVKNTAVGKALRNTARSSLNKG